MIRGNNVGIEISGFSSSRPFPNFIEGNYIGVTEDGSAVGNLYGIWINGAPNNQIGGTAKGAGNTISDNTSAGVYISGVNATGNLVEGNNILGPNNKGTKTDPTSPLPTGVFIQNSSSNTIGGAARGEIRYTVTTWVSTSSRLGAHQPTTRSWATSSASRPTAVPDSATCSTGSYS